MSEKTETKTGSTAAQIAHVLKYTNDPSRCLMMKRAIVAMRLKAPATYMMLKIFFTSSKCEMADAEEGIEGNESAPEKKGQQ